MARHLSFLVIHSIWLLLILNAAAPAAESILPAKSGGPLQLHVGYVPILSQLPMVESYDSDQFSWQHVEIVLQSFQSTTALDAAFRVGAIDIAYLPLPNVVRMKADGVGISIWGRLHSGGSTLAIAGMERRPNHRPAVIGLPSIISNEHLLLLKYMENKGLQQGLDFKVLSIQFDKAPHHLRAGNIDGIFLPAPYPSMTRSELIGHDLVVEPVKQLLWERFSTVLAINNRLLAPRYKTAMGEYFDGLHRSCRRLENDITDFGGAQTAILQEQYFTFSPQQVLASFNSNHNLLSFGYTAVTAKQINGIIDMMLKQKLLLNSVEAEDLLTVKHRFSPIPSR